MPRDSLRTSWRRLRAAGTWAAFGDGVMAVALPLVAIDSTRDPLAVAGVIAALYAPWALSAAFGPPVLRGADRRTVMGGLNTARALAAGWLGADALIGNVGLPTLYAVAVVSGLAVALVDDAERDTAAAIAPSVGGLRSSDGLAAAEVVADGFVGLPVGALLFEFLSPLPFFLVAFTSTIAALLALAIEHGVDPVHARTDGSAGVATDLRLAMRELVVDGRGWALAAAVTGVSLLGSAVLAPLVLLAVDDLGLGALGFGLLLIAAAAGSLLGGLVAPDGARRAGRRNAIAAGLIGGAAAYTGAASTEEPVAVGALLAGGAFAGMIVTVTAGVASQPTDAARRALHLLSWGAIPVGAVIGGFVADSWGLQAPLVAAGAGFACLSPLAILATRQPAVPERSAALAKMG